MKKIFFILCFLATAVASAKTTSYEITAEQYKRSDSATERVNFSLAEIAAAAGFNSPLAMQEAMQSGNIFWGNDTIGGGELTNEYTHIVCRGFYFSSDGYVVPQNNKSKSFIPYFFCYFRADTDSDEFVCHIGQVPDKCKAGDTFLVSVYLINGIDTVEFNICFSIKEDIGIPTPTTRISALDVVGETEIQVNITNESLGYIRMELKDVAEELGADMSFPQMIDNMLYARNYDFETGNMTDNLIGYINFKELYFKTEDYSEDAICPCGATRLEADSDCFIIYNLYYENYSGLLTATVHFNESEMGKRYKTELYIVYGRHAFKINLYVDTTISHKLIKPEEYKYTGKSSIKIELKTDRHTGECDIDVNHIAEKLKCATQGINFLMTDHAGRVNGDFITSYRYIREKMYEVNTKGTLYNTIYDKEEDYNFTIIWNTWLSIITIRYSKYVSAGDTLTYKVPLFFIHGDNLYEMDLTVSFISYIMEFNDGEEVGSETIYAQLPTPQNPNSPRYANLYMNYSRAAGLTGTNDLQVFAYKDQEKDILTNLGHSMKMEGYKISRDSLSIYRESNKEYLYLDPNFKYLDERYLNKNYLTASIYNSAGNISIGSFFLVNPENKKYYTVNYILEPVDEVRYMEYVGEEEMLLPIDGSISHTEFDISRATEALGIQGEQLPAETQWRANRSNKATMLYTDAGYSDAHGGFAFDAEGCVTEKEEKTAFYAGYAHEDGRHCFRTSSVVPLEDGEEYMTRLALDHGDKRYVFRIRLVNEKTYTAIAGTEAEKPRNNGIIYDLGGRSVGREGNPTEGLAKGIYICNGRKFVVK